MDSEHNTAPTQDSGYPYVRTPNIGRGRIVFENMRYISEEAYVHWTRRGVPKSGDLILAREAPVGNIAIVKGDMKLCLGQRTVLIRPNSNLVDPDFLVYYLLGDDVQNKFHGFSIGVTVPHLNMSDIRGLKLPKLPSIHEQRIIGSVLSAYDDLIENNRRRIQLLEEMVRAFYREWFVHFRFPGYEDVEMVDSKLGEIPNGWKISTLEEECHLIIGQSPKSEFYNEDGEGLPFHQGVRDFGDFIPEHRVYCTIDRRVAEPGDILFSVRAPVGRINLADTKLIIGRGIHAIRHRGGYQAHLLLQLRNKFYKDDMMGSGTVYQAVTKSDVLNIELLIPPKSLLKEFEASAEVINHLFVCLIRHNQKLSMIRDLLLPKLVSGRINISDLKIENPTDNYKLPESLV